MLAQGTKILGSSSRAFRYGDGLFETMKFVNGAIEHKERHFQRLFAGMKMLKFDVPTHFTERMVEDEVFTLCRKNHLRACARIRLVIFRGNGGLYDPENHIPHFLIDGFPLEAPRQLNSNGLVTDVCPGIQKSCDSLANLKTNNYLPYVMGAIWAKENKLNDAILLNTSSRICDSTISNIFTICRGEIITPPLSEGCVAGIMRQWLIDKLPSIGCGVSEKNITISDLLSADEVFFTNVIKGIRWVQACGKSMYKNELIKQLYHALPSPI